MIAAEGGTALALEVDLTETEVPRLGAAAGSRASVG